MTEPTRLLPPEDFPLTFEVLRSDTKAFVWGVTILQPPGGDLARVYIPPCAKWVGVPVYVRTTTGMGATTMVAAPTTPKESDG